MTTLMNRSIQCAVCGAVTEIQVLASTSMFGPSDLDMRPPEPFRNSIAAWVSCCPQCGFCAQDLQKGTPQIRSFLESSEYQARLHDPQYLALANHFRCRALIEQQKNAFADAANSLIYAAWVCDDSQRETQAADCRLQALEMIQKASASGQCICQNRESQIALTVDLLRRASRMEAAADIISVEKHSITDPVIKKIIEYQSELIERDDIRAYTVAHAMGGFNGTQSIGSATVQRNAKRWWHFWSK